MRSKVVIQSMASQYDYLHLGRVLDKVRGEILHFFHHIQALARYIVINRNGSANELEGTSRNFNPLAIFNDMKYADHCSLSFIHPFSSDDAHRLQSNLAHLETHIRV
jgi:hypothetical protein